MRKIITFLTFILAITLTSCSKDEVVNNAPVIEAQTFSVREDAILTIKVVASDIDKDTLTYTIKKDDSNLFQISDDGTLRVQASKRTRAQTYLVDVEVSDGKLTASATITINITSVA